MLLELYASPPISYNFYAHTSFDILFKKTSIVSLTRNETHSHVTWSRDTRRTSTCELEHSHRFLRASTVRPGRFGEDPPPTPPRPAEQPGPLTYGPQGGSLGSEAGAAPGGHGEPGTQEVAREATLCGWKGDGRGRETEASAGEQGAGEERDEIEGLRTPAKVARTPAPSHN